jgi:predicted  nucleic acid-binding Zn-ribbon protein
MKHTCFTCGAKFYDLFRPEPLCPKCGADQREAPKAPPKPKPARKRKRVTKRSMAPLLDDDEDVVIEEDGAPDLDLRHAGAAFDDPAAEVDDES